MYNADRKREAREMFLCLQKYVFRRCHIPWASIECDSGTPVVEIDYLKWRRHLDSKGLLKTTGLRGIVDGKGSQWLEMVFPTVTEFMDCAMGVQ